MVLHAAFKSPASVMSTSNARMGGLGGAGIRHRTATDSTPKRRAQLNTGARAPTDGVRKFLLNP